MKDYYEKNKQKWIDKSSTQEHKDKKNEARRIKYREDEEYRNNIKRKVKEYNEKNPKSKLKSSLSKYGLTIEGYEYMLRKQNYMCAICGSYGKEQNKYRKLVVDHDHKTGKVRGLLCDNCNFMIGQAKDSIDILQKAIKYLEVNATNAR